MELHRPLLFPATANTQDLPLLRHLSLYLMLIIMMRETIFVMQPTLLGQVKVQEVPLRLLEVSYSYILVNRSTFDIDKYVRKKNYLKKNTNLNMHNQYISFENTR